MLERARLPGDACVWRAFRLYLTLLAAATLSSAWIGTAFRHSRVLALVIGALVAALHLVAPICFALSYRKATRSGGSPSFSAPQGAPAAALERLCTAAAASPGLRRALPELYRQKDSLDRLDQEERRQHLRHIALQLAQRRRQMMANAAALLWCISLLASLWLSRP